jgi:hypothetical protein
MAEPIEPEKDPHLQSDPTNPSETNPDEADQIDEEGDEEIDQPGDADETTGFTFEQRRFLWTLAGLNVVAVLLGAAIIVGYLASARSQDTAITKLGDQYDTAQDEFQRARQRDIPRIVSAELSGDKDTSNEFRQEMLEAYQGERTALANWRRARGLDATDVTNDQLMAFNTNLNNLIDQDVAGARASTQPASRPAKPFGAKP